MIDFWIVVYDATGMALGEITSAREFEFTPVLDGGGRWSFSMPATDPSSTMLSSKRSIVCYGILDNQVIEIGSGIIDSIRLEYDANRNPTGWLSVSGDDMSRELSYRSVGKLVIDDGAGGETVTGPADIMTLAPPGWSLDIIKGYDETLKPIVHQFDGESVLNALIRLAELTGEHFRIGQDRTVIWMQVDTPHSGIRAISDADPVMVENSVGLAAISCIVQEYETYDIVSRVIPYGAGNGDATYTLNGTTWLPPSGYTLNASDNYIRRDATESTYGHIEQVVDFRDISSADMLAEQAYEWLKRRSEIERFYRIDLARVETILKPGYLITVEYYQYAGNVTVIGINQDLLILGASTRINADGYHTVSIRAATVDRNLDDDSTVIARAIEQSTRYQRHTQPVNVDVTGVDIETGKTLTVNETMTLDADASGQTYTFPAASGDVATENNQNVFSDIQTVSVSGGRIMLDPGSTTPLQIIRDASAAGYAVITIYRSSAAAGGLSVRHARGTEDSPSAVSNGDDTLLLEGYGHDGTTFRNNANIRFAVDGSVSSDDVPGLIKFGTRAASESSVSTRMTLTGTGRLGIGTTGPTSLLDVVGDIETGSGNYMYFGDPTTNGSWRIGRSGNNLVMERLESGSWVTKQTITP